MYDFLVLGGGSGGIASARRAASYGAKVALVESGRMGGTCVNVGCVPKKVMWSAASIAETLGHAQSYGFAMNNAAVDFNWSLLKTKRDAYISRLNGIYTSNLVKDSIDRYSGFASFENGKVKVTGETTTFLEAKRILIATGSSASVPQVPGAALGMTSDGFFELESQPKKVAIVGAGYIAVEIAGIFRALGSQVSLIIRHDEFLRSFDSVIKDSLMEEYLKVGIDVVKSHSVSSVLKSSTLDLTLSHSVSKESLKREGYDALIWAVGRHANVDRLNLPSIGVQLKKDGFIAVNEWQETNVKDVYALGDVCGVEMLTPVAIAAGRRLADRLFGGDAYKTSKLEYSLVPSVIFSHPTAGAIGLTEEQAIQTYGADQVKVYTSRFVNMYFAMMETKQITKYKIVCAGKDEKVVGLHLFGLASDEILQGFGVAMKMGATKRDFDSCVAIHPTAAEELVTMR